MVIPTKNRARFLADVVRCLLEQTVMPDELIVVDQSADDAGVSRVAALVDALPPARRPRLVHVLDPSINGAAAARNAGFDRATGDIVVCCDDDVIVEQTVLERLLTHDHVAPEYAALAPVITNYPAPGPLRRLYLAAFCLGPRDERQPVYWILAALHEPAAGAVADVHGRDDVVPALGARGRASRPALPGGLDRGGHRPLLDTVAPQRAAGDRDGRSDRPQPGSAAEPAP